jgi:uncharacterized repeat protein (TIGR01451 family)
VDPPTPAVSIRVRVPATAGVGQELEYHLSVENRSHAAAHHVLLRSPLPSKARLLRANPQPDSREPELLWKLGTLAPGDAREIVLVVASSGPGDITSCARVQFEHGQCVTTHIAQPGLQLRKHGRERALLNSTLGYQLTVANTGSTDITGIRLIDTLPAGLEHSSGHRVLTWELGSLPAGQSRTLDYQVVAKTAGQHCNRAAVTADGGLRQAAESCVTVGEAKLTLTVHGQERRYLNTGAAFQLTVSNPGTFPLSHVTIANPLPPGTTFVSASGGGRLTGDVVRWSLGTLEAGKSRTVDLVLRAQREGRICNRAIASGRSSPPTLPETGDADLIAENEACTEFIGVTGLTVELVDTDDPVEVGGQTSYVITVRNQGSRPATNVIIEATVPKELEAIRVTGPADNRKEGRVIRFSPFDLPPGAESRFEVFVQAEAAGDVRFKIDVRADQLTQGLPLHEEESTTIYTAVSSGRRIP